MMQSPNVPRRTICSRRIVLLVGYVDDMLKERKLGSTSVVIMVRASADEKRAGEILQAEASGGL